jgi:hypothetical protein
MPTRRASILPLIALCGLPLIAACGRGSARQADAAAAEAPAGEVRDSVEVRALLSWPGGELRIETTRPGGRPDGEYQVTTIQVNGDTLMADSASHSVQLIGWWEAPEAMAPEGRMPAAPLGSIALVQVLSGGIGCPAQFRVVEMTGNASPVVTDEFGGCAEEPEAVWFDADGAMRMRFPDYAKNSMRAEPGFREDPPTTWTYRTGGRLEMTEGR